MFSSSADIPPLEIGDIVFTCIAAQLFKSISKASLCWSNHVGIIIGHNGEDYIVAESRVPFSTTTTLKKFIKRSNKQHYAVKRLLEPLTEQQQKAICNEIPQRLNVLYHTGFNYDSKRQFCSKFVYEIYKAALDLDIGKLETFNDLLRNNPNATLLFWKFWFFGRIPWQRTTITPASLWMSPKLTTIFDSHPKISDYYNIKAS